LRQTTSLLIVNYRSSNLAARAVVSARESSTSPIEVIIVDNSGDAGEVQSLHETGADRVIVSPRNIGYGGGLNLARASARGSVLLLSNPDVVFAPGAIDAMTAALEDGATVVGPRLSWDSAGEWLLPPGDDPTVRDHLSEAAAAVSARWNKERDSRRIRIRLRFWTQDAPFPERTLPGAVLALGSRTFDSVGGFDADFSLYFEEHDFLRRIRRRGGTLQVIPSARCRHLYNQSARSSVEAGRAYAQSERRFFDKWYPGPVARIVSRLPRAKAMDAPRIDLTAEESIPFDRDPAETVIEVSPLETFATAAGLLPKTRSVTVPAEIWSSYRLPFLYLRVVDRKSARPLNVYRLRNTGKIEP
jgi:N-acetylglucosaminyl-diphospho-decaprenol L-rhamnosyltransferase